jgi:hypothetical protein
MSRPARKLAEVTVEEGRLYQTCGQEGGVMIEGQKESRSTGEKTGSLLFGSKRGD